MSQKVSVDSFPSKAPLPRDSERSNHGSPVGSIYQRIIQGSLTQGSSPNTSFESLSSDFGGTDVRGSPSSMFRFACNSSPADRSGLGFDEEESGSNFIDSAIDGFESPVRWTSTSRAPISIGSPEVNSSLKSPRSPLIALPAGASSFGTPGGLGGAPLVGSKKRSAAQLASPDAANTPDKVAKITDTIYNKSLTKPLNKDRTALMRDSSSVLSRAKIKGEVSSPEVEAMSSRLRDKCAGDGKYSSPYSQNKCAGNMFMSSSWATDAAYGLSTVLTGEKAPPPYLNMRHVVEGDRDGGGHCFPPGDERLPSLQDVKESPKGVVSANWEKKGELKHSSIFPLHLEARDVFYITRGSSRTEYRSVMPNLFLNEVPEAGIHIEIFQDRANPLVAKSAYPIFKVIFRADLETEVPIQLTKAGMSSTGFSDEILKTSLEIMQSVQNACVDWLSGAEPKKKGAPISYVNDKDQTVLVDIAPSMPDVGVPKGILVEVPRSYVEGLGIDVANVEKDAKAAFAARKR